MKKHEQGRLLAAIKGAFKIPSLRNVELTGPYMHSGGMKALEEVIDFYDRGGNASNIHHFATGVFIHGFTPQQKADLVAFLQGLTDERVRRIGITGALKLISFRICVVVIPLILCLTFSCFAKLP